MAVDGSLAEPRIEFDEMVSEPEHITREESDRLQTESSGARALDQQLAEEMRHRRLGGETSSAGYLRELGDRPRLPARSSDGSWRRRRRATAGRGRSWSRRSCR